MAQTSDPITGPPQITGLGKFGRLVVATSRKSGFVSCSRCRATLSGGETGPEPASCAVWWSAQ